METALVQCLLPQPAARKRGTGVGVWTCVQEVAGMSASESGAHRLLPRPLPEPPPQPSPLALRRGISMASRVTPIVQDYPPSLGDFPQRRGREVSWDPPLSIKLPLPISCMQFCPMACDLVGRGKSIQVGKQSREVIIAPVQTDVLKPPLPISPHLLLCKTPNTFIGSWVNFGGPLPWLLGLEEERKSMFISPQGKNF